MSRLISTVQFILGFILGVAIIAGLSAAAGYFYISKLATNPDKPIFAEERETSPEIKVTESNSETTSDDDSKDISNSSINTEESNSETTSNDNSETNSNSSTNTEEANAISESEEEPPLEETSEPAEELLPANAYKASVTWPQGLSLRAEPNSNSARIGGIGFNAEIIILEETSDKSWQKVLLPWSQQEGWVKGGNTKRVY